MPKPFIDENDLDLDDEFLDQTLGELCDSLDTDRVSVFLSPRDPNKFKSFADAVRHLRHTDC